MLVSSIFRTTLNDFIIDNFVEAETEFKTTQTPTTFGIFFDTIIGELLEPFFS